MTAGHDNIHGLFRADGTLESVDDLVRVLAAQRDAIASIDDRLSMLNMTINHAVKDAFSEHIRVAFPLGDPEGHRRAHELVLKHIEQRERLIAAIREKTVIGVVWLAFVWLGIAAFKEIKHALGIP